MPETNDCQAGWEAESRLLSLLEILQAMGGQSCIFRRFTSGTGDEIVWSDVCALLRDDAWMQKELSAQRFQTRNVNKLTQLQEFKIFQAKAKIIKVWEGFEDDICTLEEARQRLSDLQEVVTRIEQELIRMRQSAKLPSLQSADREAMMEELRTILTNNLDPATFDEKLAIITHL